MERIRQLLLLGSVAAALCATAAAQDRAALEPAIQLLRAHGIEPTAESIGQYLRSLHPDSSAQKRLAELVRQLGDDEFARREAATYELLRLPLLAPEELQRAAAGPDPEVRWRAQQILQTADRRSAELLAAAFEVIQGLPLKGLAAGVLAAVPLCREDWLLHGARGALGATVEPADATLLRGSLGGGHTESRVSAVGALATLAGETSAVDLVPLLEDTDLKVRFAAALAVANFGRREALPVLVDLLEAGEGEGDPQSTHLRTQSDQVLRALTGQQFGYVAYDPKQQREAAVQAWRNWLEGPGKTAPLKFPVRPGATLLGRTLISYYAHQRVIEIDDRTGKIVWEAHVANPWGCRGLPNGHRLIASYSGRMIIEYDREGKQVWTKTDLPPSPFKVRRLENGNVLVACSDSGELLEIRRDAAGTVVWQKKLDGRPMDAERLENGHTLVALQNANRIVEIDRDGKEVWSLPNMFNPLSVQRLENGNTLVCQQGAGAVRELDRSGKVVWEIAGLNNPYDAQRLPNGNTLVADMNGVREFDRQKNQKWHRPDQHASGVCRY